MEAQSLSLISRVNGCGNHGRGSWMIAPSQKTHQGQEKDHHHEALRKADEKTSQGDSTNTDGNHEARPHSIR